MKKEILFLTTAVILSMTGCGSSGQENTNKLEYYETEESTDEATAEPAQTAENEEAANQEASEAPLPEDNSVSEENTNVDWKSLYQPIIENLPSYVSFSDSTATITLTDLDLDNVPEMMVADRFGSHMYYGLNTIFYIENGVVQSCGGNVGDSAGISEFGIYPYINAADGTTVWLSNLEPMIQYGPDTYSGDSMYVTQMVYDKSGFYLEDKYMVGDTSMSLEEYAAQYTRAPLHIRKSM